MITDTLTLEEIRIRARALMKRHGLEHWKFGFDRSKKRFGCCIYNLEAISLSEVLCKLNDYKEIKNTILHEIAHALTKGDKHGLKWQACCIRIGARPKACYTPTEVNTPKLNHVYTCASCGYKWETVRKLKSLRLRYHTKCGKKGRLIKKRG